MKLTRCNIPDVFVFEPTIFEDERGYFYESFNATSFNELVGREVIFVQDNQSFSKQGVLRGLHYQAPPMSQAKLVRVVQGEIFDVVVDLRKRSRTFGYWLGKLLTSENKKQLWVPEGFAHGFLTLSEHAIVTYKTTEYYSVEHERAILWNDHNIAINWPLTENVQISTKDADACSFLEAEKFV